MSYGVTDADDQGPTIIVGLGNPILGDDGVGWHILDALEQRLRLDPLISATIGPIATDRLAVGGLSLMERLIGYRRAIILDAEVGGVPGTVRVADVEEVRGRVAAHLDCAHDVTVARAIEVARDLGQLVPRNVRVITVAVPPPISFAETLSPAVAAAVEPAVDALIDELVLTAVVGAR